MKKLIPFLDLSKQHIAIKDELDAAYNRVVKNGSFTLGGEVEAFEEEFARYCGTEFAVGVSTGTDALHLALRALGIGAGDEVITVPNTFIATAEAITMCGATPVFVDVDFNTLNINVSLIEEKITKNTKAIIPVHLYGQPADMDGIIQIAAKHGLKVVEDACQAHGAVYKGSKVGAIGNVGCFSFYPGKNLGALGDGGMVVTNDLEVATKARMLRSHGEIEKNRHSLSGYCNRLHGLQAAFLRVKLQYLDDWNEKRTITAEHYDHLLESLFLIKKIKRVSGAGHVYHLYVVRHENRDGLVKALKKQGIETGIHYPTPIHFQAAYSTLGYKAGDFPISEKAATEIISLPMFPGISEEDVGSVFRAIKVFHDTNANSKVGA